MILSVIQSGGTTSARGGVTATRSLLLMSSRTTPRTSFIDLVTHTQSLIVTCRSGPHPDTSLHKSQSTYARALVQQKQWPWTGTQSWSAWLTHIGRVVDGFFI